MMEPDMATLTELLQRERQIRDKARGSQNKTKKLWLQKGRGKMKGSKSCFGHICKLIYSQEAQLAALEYS